MAVIYAFIILVGVVVYFGIRFALTRQDRILADVDDLRPSYIRRMTEGGYHYARASLAHQQGQWFEDVTFARIDNIVHMASLAFIKDLNVEEGGTRLNGIFVGLDVPEFACVALDNNGRSDEAIDFSDLPEFNARFQVWADDERFAREFFHPALAEHLAELARRDPAMETCVFGVRDGWLTGAPYALHGIANLLPGYVEGDWLFLLQDVLNYLPPRVAEQYGFDFGVGYDAVDVMSTLMVDINDAVEVSQAEVARALR